MEIIGSKNKRRVAKAIWVRMTSFALVLTLGAHVSFGFPFFDNGCNPAEMQRSGCERMGMEPNAADGPSTSLCCLLDCGELGPISTAFNLRLPVLNVIFVDYAAITPPVAVRQLPQEQWLQSPSFTSPNSYLKNLALLI